jgi:hypothetical protein
VTRINMVLKKGEVIVLTEGAYSSFHINGFIVALKDFDLGEKARGYAKETGNYDDNEQLEGFVAWLITKELALPIEYRTIHLGDYNYFDEDFGVKASGE